MNLFLTLEFPLQQGAAKAVEQATIREACGGAGVRAVARTPADFTRRVDEEARVWKQVVEATGIEKQ